MLQIDLTDKSDMDEPLDKSFDWNVVSYTSREMLIQLEFNHPLHVSSSKRDLIRIKFVKSHFLFD